MPDMNEFCKNHPDVPAVWRCASCWSYICDDCAKHMGGYHYCETCAPAAAEHLSDEAAEGPEEKRPRIRQWLMIILAFALTALLADIIYFQYGPLADYVQTYRVQYQAASISTRVKGYEIKTSKHFTVYGKDKAVIESVSASAETYFTKMTESLLIEPEAVMKRGLFSIVLAPNDEEYVRITMEKKAGSGALADYPTKSVVIDMALCAGSLGWTLPHEIAHALVFEVMKSGNAIPDWALEGIASYEEAQFDPSQVDQRARDYNPNIIQGGNLPLSALNRPEDPNDPLTPMFYAESYSIVSYLVNTFGMLKFDMFMKNMQIGKTMDEAVNEAYKPDLKSAGTMEESWLAYIRQ